MSVTRWHDKKEKTLDQVLWKKEEKKRVCIDEMILYVNSFHSIWIPIAAAAGGTFSKNFLEFFFSFLSELRLNNSDIGISI